MTRRGCRHAELLLGDAEAGRLTPSDGLWLESHLQSCARCAARAERMTALVRALRAAAVDSGREMSAAGPRRASIPGDAGQARSDKALAAELVMRAGRLSLPASGKGPARLALAAAAVLLLAAGAFGAGIHLSQRESETAIAREERSANALDSQMDPESRPSRPPSQLSAGVLRSPATGCSGVLVQAAEDAIQSRSLRVAKAGPFSCLLELDHGLARIHVDPSASTRVVLQTRRARVTVVGTVFSVAASDDATDVTVARGKVTVEGARQWTQLEAGQRVRVHPTHHQRMTASERELDHLTTMARLPIEAPQTTGGMGQGTAASGTADTEANAIDDSRPPTPSTGPESAHQDTAESTPRRASSDPSSRSRNAAGSKLRDLRRLLASGQTVEARSEAERMVDRPAATRSRSELLTIVAESYAMEHNYRQAAEAYRLVYASGVRGPTEANAVLAAADLASRQLGDPADAVTLYERYLREYPAGELRETALAGRCRSLAGAGDRSRATDCAQEYLARYRNGLFRRQLEPLADDGGRDRARTPRSSGRQAQ